MHATTARLIFVFLVEKGFHHVGQAGLELLISNDPLASDSQSAGITGVSHCAQPRWSCYTGQQIETICIITGGSVVQLSDRMKS